MTATVTAGATGKVTFYDGASVLGTSAVAGGTAILTTKLLPSGVRKLTARYNGDVTFARSLSTQFLQTVNAQPSTTLSPVVYFGTGGSPFQVGVGDFDGDGKADIAAATHSTTTVTVRLGNGDGTFQPGVNYPAGGTPAQVAVGDVNGDGKADLVVAIDSINKVAVLLGNGNGTFQAPMLADVGMTPLWAAIGDFNGDGKPDLAVANNGDATISVLLGNGDGTFAPAVNYFGGILPRSILVEDLNNDGNADLIVTNPDSGAISVFLGLGDGTFPVRVPYSAGLGQFPSGVTSGDFNGDGKPDLALSSLVSSKVTVLIGNGDGTFQPPALYGVGAGASSVSIAAGDLNGDGMPLNPMTDLAVVNQFGFAVSVLLGNGDGTFQPAVNFPTATTPASVLISDFNGDGLSDMALGNVIPAVGILLGNLLNIAPLSGGGQSANVSTPFLSPLLAKVTDALSTPVAGAIVTFTAPGAGASANFGGPLTKTAVTGGGGAASSGTVTANAIAGGYLVSARVGFGTPATFSLTNVGVPTITPVSGGGQTTQTNAPFASQLKALVKDATNTPAPGVTVTFAGPGITTVMAVTDGTGVASATVTANSFLGSYTATATAPGVVTPAPYALTNVQATPATITAFSGGGQSTLVNTVFGAPLVAVVKDAGANGVPGVTVTFTGPGAGPGIAATVMAVTNASGVATAFVTANGIGGGPYTVNATVPSLVASAPFSLTNTTLVAASIIPTGGTPQGALVTKPFAIPLSALVRDALSNPVAGVTVTFTGPGAGPGTAATVMAVTNAAGVASAMVTANSIAGGPYTVNATVPGVGVPAAYTLTNVAGLAASITATAGTPQSTLINTAFPVALKATVTDASSNPVPGIVVTFQGPAAGPSIGAVVAITNGSGVATATVIANGIAGGPYTAKASIASLPTPANYTLTNTNGATGTITMVSGSGQSTLINTNFAAQLVALVKDAASNPAPGVTVTFAGPGAGASIVTTMAITNGSGIAMATVMANAIAGGPYLVNATAPATGAPATYSLTNTTGVPFTIAPLSGTGQSAPVNTPFASPLSAIVKDVGLNPVPGVTVTFASPAPGAGIVSTFAITNAAGIATATVVANGTTGGPYTVQATVPPVVTPALFSLTNTPAVAAASITTAGGTPQGATVNTTFALPLVALVRDAASNPVAGATVTFTGPGAGASIVTIMAVTNAAGLATAMVTANSTAGGPYIVNATVAGAPAPATYSLRNLPGNPASITATGGSGQSAFANTTFGAPLVALVKDASNNPVQGVLVKFAGPAAGPSIGTVLALTNSFGIATATVTANASVGGPYTVNATVPSVVAPATYALTNQ